MIMKAVVLWVLWVLFSLEVQAASGLIRRTPVPEPVATQPAPVVVHQAEPEPVAVDVVPEEVPVDEPLPVPVIEEWEVYDLLAKVDTAIKNKDVETLGQLINDSAAITLRTRVDGKTVAKSMDKQEYLMYLRNGWSLAKNYNYRRNNEKVLIEGDTATVTNDQFESMIVNGRYIKGDSQGKTVLQRDGQRLRITAIDAYTVM